MVGKIPIAIPECLPHWDCGSSQFTVNFGFHEQDHTNKGVLFVGHMMDTGDDSDFRRRRRR